MRFQLALHTLPAEKDEDVWTNQLISLSTSYVFNEFNCETDKLPSFMSAILGQHKQKLVARYAEWVPMAQWESPINCLHMAD